eukprot:3644714-Pyramimonas_sp.AAC.1
MQRMPKTSTPSGRRRPVTTMDFLLLDAESATSTMRKISWAGRSLRSPDAPPRSSLPLLPDP